MNFKRLFKGLHFVMVCLCLTLIFSSVTSKASSSDIGFTEDELKSDSDYVMEKSKAYLKLEYSSSEVTKIPSGCSKYISVTEKSYSGVKEKYLEFKYETFSKLDEDDKKVVLATLKKSEIYKSFTNDTKSKLISMISETADMSNSTSLESIFGDVEPDLAGGYKIYRPFNDKVRLVTAIAAIIAVTCMTASFVLDLFFINIPFAQVKIEESKLFKYVSASAKRYVQSTNNDGKVLQSSIDYFKDRVITLAVYGVLLVYLFAGKFVELIQSLTALARGF